jgi:hypothetical protein
MINFHFPVEELRDWLKTSPVYCGDYMIRHRIDFYQVWKGGQVVKRSKYLTDLVLFIMWDSDNWHPTFELNGSGMRGSRLP